MITTKVKEVKEKTKKKITISRKNEKTNTSTLSYLSVEAYLERIKRDTKDGYIQRFREIGMLIDHDVERFEYSKRIARVCAAAEYKHTETGEAFVNYNGIIVIEVAKVNPVELEQIKSEAMLLPQTLAAFTGCNGRSVEIWTTATLPDGTLPDTEEIAQLFHYEAYRTAVLCYAPMLSLPINIREPKLQNALPMALDEEPYVNPAASPFIVKMPMSVSKETVMVPNTKNNDSPILRLKPGTEDVVTVRHLFNAALGMAMEEYKHKGSVREEPFMFIPKLVAKCIDFGLPEEETCRGILGFFYEEDENELRGCVRNVYESHNPSRRSVSMMPKKQVAALKLREFLKRRYDIRYNELSGSTEFRPRYSLAFVYKELGKRELNGIRHEAALEGIEAFDSEISGLINSDFIPIFNPVEDYIGNLPQWDGKDHIAEVANMVSCDNPNWTRLFRRWVISMVAHWMAIDSEHGNNTAPILIGDQGFRKSSFCRTLLPPELRSYYTDSIDFRTKIEAERCLGRFLLVNIDEFDQLSENQFAFVKHLFQKPSATIRRSYSSVMETQRRYASFIATSNHDEILRDPTGNRRYLCVKVTEPIHLEQSINYPQFYAQIVQAIRNKERYWLDDADEALIRESNKIFEVQSPIEQLLRMTYHKPADGEDCVWLTPTEMLSELSSLPGYNKKTVNTVLIGRILTSKMKVQKKQTNKGTAYLVARN